MEWNDEAILLSTRPHGENAAIVSLLTAEHGMHAGLVPGGQGKRGQSTLQSGNHVQVCWRARLLDHLGNYTLEVVTTHSARWLDNPEILNIISSACAITEASLPERQPMGGIYAGLAALLSLPVADFWGPSYVKWEIGLLRALGYGLDFSCCAVSGETENLSHVSPRTGRAVSSKAAEPYRNKLLTLPSFLCGASEWTAADLLQGLELTGHFLTRHVFAHSHSRMAQIGDLPPARERLADYYRRLADNMAAEVA